jgi:hypothetical protein
MDTLAKIRLWSFRIALASLPIGLLGIYVGIASGAVGICGGGGWGVVPFYVGLIALPISGLAFIVWIGCLIV